MKRARIKPWSLNDEVKKRKEREEREEREQHEQQRAQEELIRSRRRDRFEIMMVAATILSSIATAATVIVGVYQYGAAKEQVSVAYDQTVAADRNRTFEEVLKGLDLVCDHFDAFTRIPVITEMTESSTGRPRISHAYKLSVDEAFERRSNLQDLSSAIRQLHQKVRYFEAWAPDDRFTTDIGWMIFNFEMPDEKKFALIPNADFRMSWQRSLVRSLAMCSIAPKELIGYMRYNQKPDLRIPEVELHLPGKRWSRIKSGDFSDPN